MTRLYMYTRVIISRAENLYHSLDLSFCIVNTHQLAWNFRVSVWDRVWRYKCASHRNFDLMPATSTISKDVQRTC